MEGFPGAHPPSGAGVWGFNQGDGVFGSSVDATGTVGLSNNGNGVFGSTAEGEKGVWGLESGASSSTPTRSASRARPAAPGAAA
jgi:hypothetical protein